MCFFALCKAKRRGKVELELSSNIGINIIEIKMFTTLHNKIQILQSLEMSRSTLGAVKKKFLNLKKRP